MNIDPNLWGPSSWKSMHYITFGYPEQPSEEVKNNTYNFFMALQYLLPCEKCRLDYKYHLLKNPLTEEILSSKAKLTRWLVDIHNAVNISIGKPVLNYEQAKEMYTNTYIEKFGIASIDARTLTIIITIFLMVCIIVIILYRRTY
jgi:hypothetical protein